MKAIVANVLFGGIFGCFSCANSTQANPVNLKPSSNKTVVSANIFPKSRVPLIPLAINPIGNALTFNSLQKYSPSPNTEYHQWLKESAATNFIPPQSRYFPVRASVEADCSLAFCDNIETGDRPQTQLDRLFVSGKQPYVHKSSTADLALGFQNTFWSSGNQHKYWGITTVEQWGDRQQLNPSQLNYTDSAPILNNGSSLLTFSGGGNHNLATATVLDRNTNSDREFKDFRGGVTYHRGITQDLTMGVGFVYEDLFAGFTQLTYDSSILPITTTLSLIAKESATDLRSHVRFEPSKSFVANYYHDGEQQKFDANLRIYPGLTLVARGNTKQRNYSTGIKVAVQNNLFSLTASAALDRERNLQWKLNSQIGRFKFVHSSEKAKTNTELSNQLVDLTGFGFQCSAFVKYQTRQVKQGEQEFVVWGGKLSSQAKVSPNLHQWNFDLGYGIGSEGRGWIANTSVALKPSLLLKLNYQEISTVSDETKVKLELSSH